MKPLYQALICCFVKFVFSIRKSISSLGSFLLPAAPILKNLRLPFRCFLSLSCPFPEDLENGAEHLRRLSCNLVERPLDEETRLDMFGDTAHYE